MAERSEQRLQEHGQHVGRPPVQGGRPGHVGRPPVQGGRPGAACGPPPVQGGRPVVTRVESGGVGKPQHCGLQQGIQVVVEGNSE